MKFLFVILGCAVFSFARPVQAEFPALARALQTELAAASPSLALQSVLVAVDESFDTKKHVSWNLAAAIETEIVAQLTANKVTATDNDSDERFAWMRRPNAAAIRRFQKEARYDRLITANFSNLQSELAIELSVYDQKDSKPLRQFEVRIPLADLEMSVNIPELNRQVVSFVVKHRGRAIGDGRSWTAAKDALAAAGAQHYGLYNFGRRLGPIEAVLPGDILQFENVQLEGRYHQQRLDLDNHTAIVVDIASLTRIKILHQDFASQGKKIQESRLELGELKQGTFALFRPMDDDAILPRSELPYRRSRPNILYDSAGAIDLLSTLNPQRDTVSGIWNRINGALTCHADKMCKLQIPVDVPNSYVLRANVKRIAGENAYVIIFVIDGRQAMLTLDGYSKNITYGLGMIDGKKASINETTGRKKILPINQMVEVEIIVKPGSVLVRTDQETLIEWKGDTSRFSMNPKWQAPNKDWIHLGSYLAEFETTKLTLTRIEKHP